MGVFLFIGGPASVCGWVNFSILWPHTPVQTKLKCPPLGSKPKIIHKDHADDPPEDSASQDASFSGDNENDNYDNYHPLSTKRKRNETSTTVSLDLFHDFLGKLDERFSVLESAINQMPSHWKSVSRLIKMAVPVKC